MSKIEFRDLYDKNRKLTGEKIKKGQEIPFGKYYITVLVFIENDKGEVLLQRRSPVKGGAWASTGGHPKSGESSLEGMMAEIKEELGITVEKTQLKLFKTIISNNDFLDLYYLKKNISLQDITMQKEEVADVKWFTKNEIEKIITDGNFFKYNINEYYYFLEYINDNRKKHITNTIE